MKWTVMTARLRGDVVVIDLAWTNGQYGEDELSALILQLLDQGFRRYVLNLVRVPCLESSALGGLARAHTTATRRGGKLSLVDAHGRVRHLLEATGLAWTFEVFTSQNAAVGSFGNHRARDMAFPGSVSSPATRAL
jgi:anti-anti-sigma factor